MGLNKDLSFTEVDRTENIRRISEVANLMIDAGLIVLAAFVSPYQKDRESIRQLVKDANFVEIFVDATLETCEQRDVKGLYKKARAGEIKNLTGLNAPYEAPQNPDIVIKTDEIGVQEAAQKVFQLIAPKLKINDE
jgi:adenylylsulfate kinase